MDIKSVAFMVLLLSLSDYVLSIPSKYNTTFYRLDDDLFRNYNKHIRPSVEDGKPTPISIATYLYELIKVEESVNTLELTGVFVQEWEDPMLKWNPSDYDNVKGLSVQADQIWIPYMMLFNNGKRSKLKGESTEKEKKLENEKWYHGLIPRKDMQILLVNDGDFVVRITEMDKEKKLVLSTMSKGELRHFVIKQTSDDRHYIEGRSFSSVQALVSFYMLTREIISKKSPAVIIHPVPRQEWEARHEDIFLGKELGSGAFGTVMKGRLRLENGKTMGVAVKVLKAKDISHEQKLKFLNEARIMRDYQHPNIIRFFGVAASLEPLMLILELAPNGSVKEWLRKHKPNVPPETRTRFCVEASKGMAYLGTRAVPVIHRDLAARNCLLGSKLELKITDFGLSKDKEMYQIVSTKQIPIKWLAPECLRGEPYTTQSDVWSYGVLMWEIFSFAEEPYPGLRNAEVQIKVTREKYRMEPPKDMPKSMAEIMLRCWEVEQKKRPQFVEIAPYLDTTFSSSIHR